MSAQLDLIVPMKPPHTGKSRLRGATGGDGATQRHSRLVLALAEDTLRAARAVPGVRRVLVVATETASLAALAEPDVELLEETGGAGLNSALSQAEATLRASDSHAVIGVLQGDLPALRPADLDSAVRESAGRRAFVADRHGTGTTLLLSAPAGPLCPRFGPDSANAHAASGAAPLDTRAPSLRGDVDTPPDLAHARELGLGPRTRALLGTACVLS